jgi:hypothetical protein
MTLNPSTTARRFRAPWAIFWVGLGLRLVCIVVGHTYRIRVPMNHFGFGWEMGRIAQSLALGQGYANPFNGPSGPTAWTPPLYPLLMAASFKMFGIYTNAAAFFLLACNSVLSAAIAPAVYEIAARCFDAGRFARRSSKYAAPVARWSAWLWAVYPAALQYAIHWIWEMSLSTCLFTWTVVLALRLRGVGEGPGPRAQGLEGGSDAGSLDPKPWILEPRYGNWVVFGLLWGLVALSNASLLLCLPAMILWVLWPRIWEPKTLLRPVVGAALACVVFAAVMAPWVMRNERVLHAFIPTRSNLGVELYASSLESHDAFPWGTAMPLWAGDPEFKRFVRLGEVEYARVRGNEAKARLRADPRLFWRYTRDRFLFFWDGTPHPPDRHPAQEYLRNLSFSFLSLCGLLGLALALKRRLPGAGLMALVFLLVPLPYYLVTVQARFRHPIEPLIAVLGVYLFRSTQPRKVAL